jgi:hypothetical protein
MKELGNYLRGYRARTAEVFPARVVSRLADGDYLVTLQHTGGEVRATRGQLVTELLPGQTVTVTRTDASGVSRNGNYIIIAPGPPTGGKGSSNGTPITTDRPREGVSILSFSPTLLQIRSGGRGTITLYGTGFTSSTSIAFSGTGLSQYQPAVATATSLTVYVTASLVTDRGRYTVAVGGVSLGYVVEVISVGILFCGDGSKVMGYNAATDSVLWVTDVAPHNPSALIAVDSYLYGWGNGRMFRYNRLTGVSSVLNAGLTNDGGSYPARGVAWDGDYFYVVIDGRVVKIDTAGTVAATSADMTGTGQLSYDGTYLWHTPANTALHRINPTDLSKTTVVTASALNYHADDGTYIYATAHDSAASNTVFKYRKSDMTLVGSMSGISYPWGIVYADGMLYVISHALVTPSAVSIKQIDPDTMTLTGVAANAVGLMQEWLAWDGATLWLASDDYILGYDLDLTQTRSKDITAYAAFQPKFAAIG